MKRILFIACAVLMAAHASAQGFHIRGDVADVPDGTKLYLTLVKPSFANIDSTYVKDGHFEFVGKHQIEPLWTLVRVDKQFSPLADFYLEDGDISIKGVRYKTRTTGTPVNSQNNLYNDSILLLYSKIYEYNTLMATDELKKDSCLHGIKSVNDEIFRRHLDFIRSYPDSPVSLRIAEYGTRGLSSSDALKLLSLFSPRLQQDETVKKNIEIAHALVKTAHGATAPLFSLPDAEGKTVALNNYLGKYVLIDFWASWCHPCRASFPAIAELYNKYKSKGLVVIGVSLDRSEHAWHKALAEEKTPWVMLHDAKGIVANDYAVKTIPLLVLLDRQGKVVGRYDKQEISSVLSKLF